jgi:hypothetical protein
MSVPGETGTRTEVLRCIQHVTIITCTISTSAKSAFPAHSAISGVPAGTNYISWGIHWLVPLLIFALTPNCCANYP